MVVVLDCCLRRKEGSVNGLDDIISFRDLANFSGLFP